MYVLFVFGINVILSAIHFQMISMLVGLALLVPNLAMGARRLHDTGRSGWLQILGLIPIIGWIILIIWCAEETKPADNEYGAPAKPKMVATDATHTTSTETTQASDNAQTTTHPE